MDMNEKLAELRKAKGLTQKDLAETLHVSRQAISRWEVGTAVPSLDNLVSLSEVCNVPLDELVHSGMGQTSSTRSVSPLFQSAAGAALLVGQEGLAPFHVLFLVNQRESPTGSPTNMDGAA